MRFFTPFLSVVTLVVSALAAPHDAVPGEISTRDWQVGEATHYVPGVGACGRTNTDTDHVVAVSATLFDHFQGYQGSNPNDNPICNRQIVATYQGNSVTANIADICVSCVESHLDLSTAAFERLADPTLGVITGVFWEII